MNYTWLQPIAIEVESCVHELVNAKVEDGGDFSIWAYGHIKDAGSTWESIITPEEQMRDDDAFRHVAIHLDFYWLMECRDKDEAIGLLHSWHNRLCSTNR